VPMSLLLLLSLLKLLVLLFNVFFVWLDGIAGKIERDLNLLCSKGGKLSVKGLLLTKIVRNLFLPKLLISFLQRGKGISKKLRSLLSFG
jgi:hypothetical protein